MVEECAVEGCDRPVEVYQDFGFFCVGSCRECAEEIEQDVPMYDPAYDDPEPARDDPF